VAGDIDAIEQAVVQALSGMNGEAHLPLPADSGV
jgi:hypothetical protein